jgi:hypothetical protein
MYRLCQNFYLLTFHRYYGAGGGTRTRDPNLGKVVLYQLSYTRDKKVCTPGTLKYNKVVFSCQPKTDCFMRIIVCKRGFDILDGADQLW